jgi:uncharacterized protein YndB with AHSA1/START domain
MRVERRCIIQADREAVWKIVSDPDCYPKFMTNLERWESANDQAAGVGARYTVHWRIGSVPVGGLIEVVEFGESSDLAWWASPASHCVAGSGCEMLGQAKQR